MAHRPFASSPYIVGKSALTPAEPHIPAEESLCPVVSHDWVNAEYKHLVVDASPKALAVRPGQFFNLLCPSPDEGELWLRRPQALIASTRPNAASSSCTNASAAAPTDWRVSSTATTSTWSAARRRLQHRSRLEARRRARPRVGLHPRADLPARGRERHRSDRDPERAQPGIRDGGDLFARVGEVIGVLDTDGTSGWRTSRRSFTRLIAERRADAFYTCGSNRLLQLMKRVGKAHGIPGQVAMEQVMACGLGLALLRLRAYLRGRRQEGASPRVHRRAGVRSAGGGRMVDMGARSGADTE